MVAPRMIGVSVRELFEKGSGASSYCAVHQDASGKARDTMLAIAKAIGSTRVGSIMGSVALETEIDLFMEFIGAPADVGWGKVRAEQGHRRPWTQSLRKIHVEFGKEAWKLFGPYVCGGYDGPDLGPSGSGRYSTRRAALS